MLARCAVSYFGLGTYCMMDVILDELQNGGIDIDMKTLSYHINHSLEEYKTLYEQMAIRVDADSFHEIFHGINVNSFGRAMAYLTLIYSSNIAEDKMREAVNLVVTVLKDMDLTAFKVE